MKPIHLLTLGLLAGSLSARAQFNSGSTGADGALNVTTNTTLDLPADGIFHFTTIVVETNATLRFNRNVKNTPVYLLASGDVNIRGTIDVSGENAPTGLRLEGGKGGPGGFDGGSPGFDTAPPGFGYGPGGGGPGDVNCRCGCGPSSVGPGVYAVGPNPSHSVSTNRGTVYGSGLLVPLLGGSGGAGTYGSPGVGGGGGGGAIAIASNSRIQVSGQISANGGQSFVQVDGSPCGGIRHANPGSGGAIRLVAPAVDGVGSLSAAGPAANEGRIRIDCIDRRFLAFNSRPAPSVGNYMITFPASAPRLDLLNVAGTAIPEGSGPVTIQLPNGSTTNRAVTVQARNFNNTVPIEVVLTPQSGPRVVYTNIIDNASDNPATVTVNVGLPVSTPVTVSAWTRVP